MRKVPIGFVVAALLGMAWAPEAPPGNVLKLIEQLRSPDLNLGAGAADAIVFMQPPPKEAIPALVDILSTHAKADNRAIAAMTLMRLGEMSVASRPELLEPMRQAVPALVKALQDTEVRVRQFSVHTLGYVGTGSEEAVNAVAAVLSDPNEAYQTQIAAAYALGKAETLTPAAVQALEGAALNPDGDLAAAAMAALPAESTVIMRSLAASDPRVQAAAARALGRTSLTPAAVAALAECLGAAAEEVRAAAARTLASKAVPADVPVVLKGLKAGEAGTPASAPDILAQAQQLWPAYVEAMKHADPAVRAGASEVLGYVPEAQAYVPLLVEALADSVAEVRRAAAGAFTHEKRIADAKPALPALSAALKDPDEGVRIQAARALDVQHEHAADAAPALAEAMNDANPKVAAYAAMALTWQRPDAAGLVSELAGAVDIEDAALRQKLPAALARTTAESDQSRATLVRLLKDADPVVAEQSLKALSTYTLDEATFKAIAAEVGESGGRLHSRLDVLGRFRDPQVLSLLGESLGKQYGAYAALEELGTAALPKLAELLESPDVKVRQQAARLLADQCWETPEAVMALAQGLDDSDEEVQLWALKGIDRAGAKAAPAVPALIEALRDKNATVRWQVALTLDGIGPVAVRPALAELTRALKDPDEKVRAAAAEALERVGQDAAAAVTDLMRLLGDDSESVRRSAARTLSGVGEAAAPALVKALANPRVNVRLGAIEALRWQRRLPEAAVAALIAAMEADEEPGVRSAAVEALGRRGGTPEAAREPLRRMLRDPLPQVRASAALSFANPDQFGPEELQALLPLLEDPEAVVRRGATSSLIWNGTQMPECVALLAKRLREDPDAQVRAAAVHALEIRRAQAQPALAELIGATREQALGSRRQAITAIGHIGPAAEEAVPRLIELLEDAEARSEAIKALGAIGSNAAAAIPALVRLLESGDVGSQGDAAKAIAEMGLEARQAVPALEKMAQSESEYSRSVAVFALRQIQPEVAEKYLPKPAP